MKILVIGSEGFIGKHLMEQGRALGHAMVGIDQASPSRRSSWDLNTQSFLKEELRNTERVIHAAGILGTYETLENVEKAVVENIQGTVRVLNVCRSVGIPMTYLTLGNNWLNPYSITKNCAAEFVRMYYRVHGLPTQVAICYNVFGPYQKWKPVRKIVPEFMTRILRGQELQLFNNGEQLVDMVYAPDLARAILCSSGAGTEHYGSGIPRRVSEVAGDCVKALATGECIRMDFMGGRPGETGPAAIAPYSIPDQTPYEEALKITAEWYRHALQEQAGNDRVAA